MHISSKNEYWLACFTSINPSDNVSGRDANRCNSGL